MPHWAVAAELACADALAFDRAMKLRTSLLVGALLGLPLAAPGCDKGSSTDPDAATAADPEEARLVENTQAKPGDVTTCPYSGKKFVPVWHCVTVAFAFGSLSDRSIDSGRPTVGPRPTMTTWRCSMGTLKRASSSTIPSGVPGRG